MNTNTEPRLLHREERYCGSAVIGGVWLLFYFLLAFWSFSDDYRTEKGRQPIAISQAAGK